MAYKYSPSTIAAMQRMFYQEGETLRVISATFGINPVYADHLINYVDPEVRRQQMAARAEARKAAQARLPRIKKARTERATLPGKIGRPLALSREQVCQILEDRRHRKMKKYKLAQIHHISTELLRQILTGQSYSQYTGIMYQPKKGKQ